MNTPKILLSAGEASSDMYAARLAKALRERTGAEFFGMGGPRMAEAGVELIADYHEVAVVGIAEVLHKIPTVIKVQNRLAREAKKRNANLAILVDSPGTHLGVARRLKNYGIPVGYFIGPQVWAWRPGRVRVVKRLVKRIVVIFPVRRKNLSRRRCASEFRWPPASGRRAPDDHTRRILAQARPGSGAPHRHAPARAAAEAKLRAITPQ